MLINNAGYELAGALEELTAEEIRAQFETNFFGVVRMIDAAFCRRCVGRSGGSTSSMSVRSLVFRRFRSLASTPPASLPWKGKPYRYELNPFNIHVSMTEAGFLKTPMMNHRQIAANRITEYDPWRQRALDAIRADEEGAWLKRSWPKRCSRSFPARRRGCAPDWATSQVRHAFTAISPRRTVRTGVRRTFSLDKTR